MNFLVLSCDGIGPEIIEASVAVLDALNIKLTLNLEYDYDDVGFVSLEKYGTTLREEVLEKARRCDGVILGTQSHADYPPPDEGGRNVSAGFRVGLDLYANVRPARTRPFLPSNLARGKTMDLVIMREATEGFYPDRNMTKGWGEVMPSPDMALSTRKITRHCSERIARRAFEWAMMRKKKVTAIHKANSFHMTDGLFLEAVCDVSSEFPEVELEDMLVDAAAAHLVRTPESFDVLVTTNFYGDILSDLASELSGSLGLAGSVMASDTLCCAQAQHGSAPDIAGKGIANPASMMLSIAMLLTWIGDNRGEPKFLEAGTIMTDAVDKALAVPEVRTKDLGGNASTSAFSEAVVDLI